MKAKGQSSATDSRQRIIDAALRLFAEQGLDGTTTKQIATDAGVNEVTIFRIFGTKQELFHTVVAQMLPLRDIRESVNFDAEGRLDEVMLRNAKVVMRILSANRHVIQMMVGELWRHPELSEKVFQAVMTPMVEFLADKFERLMDAGRMRRTDPMVAARAWIGMIQSYFIFNYMLRAAPPSPDSEDIALKGFVEVFLDGMRGEEK